MGLKTIYDCCAAPSEELFVLPAALDSYELTAYAEAERFRAEWILSGTYTAEELEELQELSKWQSYYSKTKQ